MSVAHLSDVDAWRVACFGAAANHRAAACVGTCEYEDRSSGWQRTRCSERLHRAAPAADVGGSLRPRMTDTAPILTEGLSPTIVTEDVPYLLFSI